MKFIILTAIIISIIIFIRFVYKEYKSLDDPPVHPDNEFVKEWIRQCIAYGDDPYIFLRAGYTYDFILERIAELDEEFEEEKYE